VISRHKNQRSARQKPYGARRAKLAEKTRNVVRSPLLAAPRGLQNPGVESRQRGVRRGHQRSHARSRKLYDREFDARGGWNNGFRSCAEWLSYRVGLDLHAARERVRVARALGQLPRLAQALAHGKLSYAKVRALTRVATPETEERLLTVGLAGTACHVERIVRGWRRVDRIAEARETARRHNCRSLRVYQDEDGMVVVRGRLEPEAGAVLMKALEAARETLYQHTRPQTFDHPVDVSAETPCFEHWGAPQK
jgi:Domain of unknown function (DUF222)